MQASLLRLSYVVAMFASSVVPAAAQGTIDAMVVAQAAPAPRRALPLPNKPVTEDENAKALRINNWTIGLAGGLLEGTFSKYAADLGKALDDGDNLRVLPIISYGAVGNVTDLIYLKGVDFAITYADVLDHFKNVEKIPGIERRVNYVIPMFQGEFHLYVRPEIKTIQDLAGKKVGFNTVGSAANYTGNIVFDRLGVKVEKVFMNNSLALEAMRKGELAGIVHVVGKPNELFTSFKPEPGFHFLPLEYTEKFQDYYTPGELTSADYPNLIEKGEKIETISVQALLGRLQLAARYGPLSPLRALRGVPVRALRQAARGSLSARLERDEPGRHHPRLDALPARAGDARTESRRGPRSIQPLRARRRPVPRPTVQPSRSGCSSNSWNGASNRSDKRPCDRPLLLFTGARPRGRKSWGDRRCSQIQGG